MKMLSVLTEDAGISGWRAVGFSDETSWDLLWSGDRDDLLSLFEERLEPYSKFHSLDFRSSKGIIISVEVSAGSSEMTAGRLLGHKIEINVEGCGESASRVARAIFRGIVDAWDPAVALLTDVNLGKLEDVKRFWRVRPGYMVWTNDFLSRIEHFDEFIVHVERFGRGTLITADPGLSPEQTYDTVMGLYQANGMWNLPHEPVQAMEVSSRGDVPQLVDVGDAPPPLDAEGEGEFVDPGEVYRQQITGWLPDEAGNVPLWVQPEGSSTVPVRFMGHTRRGDTEVFLHAFFGNERFGDVDDELGVLSSARILSVASWQSSVVPEGALLEWHANTVSAATGLRNFFAVQGLSNVRVVHTPALEGSGDE